MLKLECYRKTYRTNHCSERTLAPCLKKKKRTPWVLRRVVLRRTPNPTPWRLESPLAGPRLRCARLGFWGRRGDSASDSTLTAFKCGRGHFCPDGGVVCEVLVILLSAGICASAYTSPLSMISLPREPFSYPTPCARDTREDQDSGSGPRDLIKKIWK